MELGGVPVGRSVGGWWVGGHSVGGRSVGGQSVGGRSVGGRSVGRPVGRWSATDRHTDTQTDRDCWN